jgi:phenylacetate-coenzyme A ligase PaaK-like adenylate-forming protein
MNECVPSGASSRRILKLLWTSKSFHCSQSRRSGGVYTLIFSRIITDKRRILSGVATGGSTGEPFTCFADQHQLEIRWASTLRSVEWSGYQFGDKQARLWHQTIGMRRNAGYSGENRCALVSTLVYSSI